MNAENRQTPLVVTGTQRLTDKGMFVGIPSNLTINSSGYYIIDVRRGLVPNFPPSVLTVGTTAGKNFFGANVAYSNRIAHPNSSVYMLPPTAMMAELAKDAADIIHSVNARTVLISGGEDLGEDYTGEAPDSPLTKWYGTNRERDRIESGILREIIERDDIFFIGICRGLQILTAELTNKAVLPREIERHRPPHDPITHEISTLPDHHPVINILPPEINEAIGFPDIQRVSSHHHQGILLNELQPFLSDLAARGWYVALVADVDGIVNIEALVKAKQDINGNWIVLGAAVQGHPERPSGQHDKSPEEWQQAEQGNKKIAEWLLEKQYAFTS